MNGRHSVSIQTHNRLFSKIIKETWLWVETKVFFSLNGFHAAFSPQYAVLCYKSKPSLSTSVFLLTPSRYLPWPLNAQAQFHIWIPHTKR